MECDVDEKFNDDDNLGHSNSKTAINPKNVSSKNNCNRKRRRKRPRTKALRQTIREKVSSFYLLFSSKRKCGNFLIGSALSCMAHVVTVTHLKRLVI